MSLHQYPPWCIPADHSFVVKKGKKEQLRSLFLGAGMNRDSLCSRPHTKVHRTSFVVLQREEEKLLQLLNLQRSKYRHSVLLLGPPCFSAIGPHWPSVLKCCCHTSYHSNWRGALALLFVSTHPQVFSRFWQKILETYLSVSNARIEK